MTNKEEQLNTQQLNQARGNAPQKKEKESPTTTTEKTRIESNTAKNLLILLVAVIFDILALIPLINIVFNTIFVIILILAYGKSGKKEGGTLKVVATSFIGSVFDFFFSILPVNTATALVRIFV